MSHAARRIAITITALIAAAAAATAAAPSADHQTPRVLADHILCC